MKKNFIKVAFVAAFASIAGYGVYTSQQKVEMSDLAKADVEALANDEDLNLDDFNDNCYWYQDKDCYYLIVSPDGNTVWWHSNFEERF